MKISLRAIHSFVAMCCMGLAIPATAQTTQSLPSAPPADLQQQVDQLQGIVGDLQQRLDQADAVAAHQSNVGAIPSSRRNPSGFRPGEAACGSVCNYYRCFDWSQDAYISVGAGLRTSYFAAENMAANGTNYSKDWVLDSTRLYFNGRGHKYIGFEVNTDIQNNYIRPFVTDNDAVQFRLLDAIAKFGDGGAINLWAGRMLPPSDRANLSGPFFINTYDFPFVSNEAAIFDGRDDGAVLWGLVGNQALKYQVGLYDGANSIPGGTNPSDSPQFNGRVVYNFLDPETGYYNQSTYYGAKEILAVGAAVIHQNNGVYSATDGVSDFTSWTIDGLYETKLNRGGVFTFNSAYYNYNTNVVTDDLNANSRDGNAGLAEVAYMLPKAYQFGRIAGHFRPIFRWQEYDRTFKAAAAQQAVITRGTDLELQYVINGSNARISAGWGQRDLADGRNNIDVFLLGTQLQF